ncbi:MAG: DUF4215 domain-containing protein [Myxococcota bacterium]
MRSFSLPPLVTALGLVAACTATEDPIGALEPDPSPSAGATDFAAASVPPADSVPASCQDTADAEACCAPGEVLVEGTPGDDVLDHGAGTDTHCVFAFEGDDSVDLGSSGGRALLGSGDDQFSGASGSELVLGGSGADVIMGYAGDDELHGGLQGDALLGGYGDDVLVPGPGLDYVDGGMGNDVIYINHACEIEPGEWIDGGRGRDTLVSPLSFDELIALGVTVDGIEKLVIGSDPCASECSEPPECGEHGECVPDDDGEAMCSCEEGFTGPECDIPCEEGVSCELKVFYHSNGTVNGAIMRGGLLFEAEDEAGAHLGLKQWLAEHHELVQIDSTETLDVFEDLVLTEPDFREHGGLRLLKLEQTYRGHRIIGPEAQMTATFAPGKGVLSFAGTVVDPRVDFEGFDQPVSQQLAEQAILDRWQEVGDMLVGVSVVGMELVAVPQHQSMGWFGIVARPAAPPFSDSNEYGYVVVPAAPDSAGGVRPILLAWGSLRHPSPSDPADMEVRASPFTDDIGEVVDSTMWSSLPTGGPLEGSTFTPNGMDLGYKLGNSRLQIYDAEGMQVPTVVEPMVAPEPMFGAPRAAVDEWNMQNTFMHLAAATELIDPIKEGNWDYDKERWPEGVDANRVANLVAFVNAGSGSCPSQGQCYTTPLWSDAPKWADADHEFFRADAPGQAIARQPLISLTIDVPDVTLHEFGHYFDDFSSADIMSADAPVGDCPPWAMSIADCNPGCHADTTDESRPLLETVACISAQTLASNIYSDIDFDSNCGAAYDTGDWNNALTGVPVASPNCMVDESQFQHFDDTRPVVPGPNGWYCSQMEGYEQGAVMQAWWSIIHGKVCLGQAPWTCDDIEGLDDPKHAALEALHYGLSLSNEQWYEMFFENIGVYYACEFGPQTYADYVQVMSNHGLMEANTPPPVCPDICGDGIVGPNEACDDGNNNNGDGCSASCWPEPNGGGGGGGNGLLDGDPCDELWDYPGGTGLTDRPWGSAQNTEEELYYHWCGADPNLTCVVENDQHVCRSCGMDKLPGCYCESDFECQSLDPQAKCYGPGLHGPEFGCFVPNEAPVYACLEPCQTNGKVCAWDPGEFMSGTCFNEYCLEPGPDFACERDVGVECFEEAELCYLPGQPSCEDDGLPCDGGAGMCSLRWSGQVYECCHDGCLIPLNAS